MVGIREMGNMGFSEEKLEVVGSGGDRGGWVGCLKSNRGKWNDS
jgi:hypothetical protein